MCLSTRVPAARTSPYHRRAASLAPVLMLLAVAAAPAAGEPCKMGRAGVLPVTMEDMQPLVHAAINGKDALFLADSGAFFSMLSTAGARQFNLTLEHVNHNFTVHGVGGASQVWMTTVQTFTIFNLDLPKVPFLVVDNDMGHGAIGVLGQNVFQLGDIEYDLADGVINILRTHGDCRKTSLAYWANDKGLPYSEIDVDFGRAENPRTTGDAYVDGRRIRFELDTGSGASVLTLDAARRAGVTPDSPGVSAGGSTYGIGRRTVRTWIAPFASFKIGDEEIRNTHLRIGDVKLDGVDMLLGADFLLSHRLLAASSQRKLYFTYNGGPVFNLTTVPTPAPAAPAAGGTATAGDTSSGVPAAATAATQAAQPEQLDAAGYARRGSASTSRRDYEHALADLSRAIELAPTESDYFYERARAYWSSGHADKALDDFGQAIKLQPSSVPALMARAELRARRGDPAEAISPDLDAVDRAAPKQAGVRLELGNLYERIHNYPVAITQFDEWISAHHPDDVEMPRARNERCWVRALTGQGLDQALDDCNFAVHREPKTASFHDSRGLVYLRLGKYDKAIADYDAALALNPKIAWSLYGRGLAKQHLGQAAAGQTDVAAATALAPRIAEEAASRGLVP